MSGTLTVFETILKGGTIRHLVRWTYSTDDAIRLNALWAIKNSLFNAKSKEIVAIMGAMGWDHYAECIWFIVTYSPADG